MSIKILVDSASDYSPEEAKRDGIEYIPLSVFFGEEEFKDNINLSHEEFFQKLIKADTLPRTGQITPYEYEEKLKELTKDGDQVVVITISEKISGCYQNVCNVAADFPEGQVVIVDSASASIGEHVLAKYAAELRDRGLSISEIEEELNREKKNICVFARLNTIEYLWKGGRISNPSAIVGTLLSIKPITTMRDGLGVMVGKARGSKAAKKLYRDLLLEQTGVDYQKPACFAYGDVNDALLRTFLEENRDIYEKFEDISLSSIGCTIGTHVGPGAIIVAFFLDSK